MNALPPWSFITEDYPSNKQSGQSTSTFWQEREEQYMKWQFQRTSKDQHFNQQHGWHQIREIDIHHKKPLTDSITRNQSLIPSHDLRIKPSTLQIHCICNLCAASAYNLYHVLCVLHTHSSPSTNRAIIQNLYQQLVKHFDLFTPDLRV